MSNVKLYGNYTNGESQPVTVPKVVAIHSQPNEELRFIGTDAFEVNDNSIWLPDCLWDECTSNPRVDGAADEQAKKEQGT